MLPINCIYEDNCISLLKQLDKESVDLFVTSPPYKEEDGYSPGLIFMLAHETFRVLKKNSLFFLNFGHLANYKTRPFEVCMEFERAGYKLIDTITWEKIQYSPIQGNKRVNNVTEFIFMLCKGRVPALDRLSIGVPYADKSNIGRYSDKDLKCRGNHWRMGYETIQKRSQKLHKDRFPEELPSNCIKLANLKPGALVCDPFSGSGTTCFVAKKLQMNFIGFELNPCHVATSKKRLEILNS